MHGNVWEWCADHWHDNYEGALADGSASIKDSRGAAAARVVRGGSWGSDTQDVRSASRIANVPDNRDDSFGFRCDRVLS
jgi:formylglycine-generating enzyme required for sulfatase activity